MIFDIGKQYNNIEETARARQIKFLRESNDALKLSNPQFKYNLMLTVNVEKIPDFLILMLKFRRYDKIASTNIGI